MTVRSHPRHFSLGYLTTTTQLSHIFLALSHSECAPSDVSVDIGSCTRGLEIPGVADYAVGMYHHWT